MSEYLVGGLLGFLICLIFVLGFAIFIAVPQYEDGQRINAEFLCASHGKKLVDYEGADVKWMLEEVTCDGPLEIECEDCVTFVKQDWQRK